MNVFLLLTAIDRFWGNCYRRTRRYFLVSGMTAEKSIPLSRISRMISRTAWRCSLSNKKILQARYMIQMLPRAAFAAVPSPVQQKTAHAGIIPPRMSGFLAVVDFLALDFLRHRGKRPCCALLGIQFFAGFLAELGAGDELAHA